MTITFTGKIWFWKGPAPWYFVTVPAEDCKILHAVSKDVTYGWGMIPVTATINKTTWKTSLFPKDGTYIVPIKSDVRKAEELEDGDELTILLDIDLFLHG